MPRGRPSDFTDEIAAEICARISSGESLVAICRDDHLPSRGTVMRWVATNEDFRDKYLASARARTDSYAEQLVEIADDPEIDPNKAKVMLHARMWVMARLEPKKWGDKIQAEHSGPDGGPIKGEITHIDRAKAMVALIQRARAEKEQGGD